MTNLLSFVMEISNACAASYKYVTNQQAHLHWFLKLLLQVTKRYLSWKKELHKRFGQVWRHSHDSKQQNTSTLSHTVPKCVCLRVLCFLFVANTVQRRRTRGLTFDRKAKTCKNEYYVSKRWCTQWQTIYNEWFAMRTTLLHICASHHA